MKLNDKLNTHLHRIHLIADATIGVLALVSLLIPETFRFFVSLDILFHILIFTLAFSVILFEKLLHHHKGTISE